MREYDSVSEILSIIKESVSKGKSKKVQVYIKFNIIKDNDNLVVVVSFHEARRPMILMSCKNK